MEKHKKEYVVQILDRTLKKNPPVTFDIPKGSIISDIFFDQHDTLWLIYSSEEDWAYLSSSTYTGLRYRGIFKKLRYINSVLLLLFCIAYTQVKIFPFHGVWGIIAWGLTLSTTYSLVTVFYIDDVTLNIFLVFVRKAKALWKPAEEEHLIMHKKNTFSSGSRFHFSFPLPSKMYPDLETEHSRVSWKLRGIISRPFHIGEITEIDLKIKPLKY